jgi:hypothetical protein
MPKFLALYTGQPGASLELDKALIPKGMAAWKDWVERNGNQIVDSGAPLGKTKKVSADGIIDTRNNVTAYTIIEAQDHEAAAKLFERHPHFSIFPGDGVEIMPLLPIPE